MNFPLRADEMRPARETCERCHSPDKFSDDKLKEIKNFGTDVDNTPTSTFLTMKTGGGNERQGLGRGIHWHVQNTLYYLPTDESEQEIPLVRVVEKDGSLTDYVDIESPVDLSRLIPGSSKRWTASLATTASLIWSCRRKSASIKCCRARSSIRPFLKSVCGPPRY